MFTPATSPVNVPAPQSPAPNDAILNNNNEEKKNGEEKEEEEGYLLRNSPSRSYSQ